VGRPPDSLASSAIGGAPQFFLRAELGQARLQRNSVQSIMEIALPCPQGHRHKQLPTPVLVQ